MKKIKFNINETVRRLVRWALQSEITNLETQIAKNEYQYNRLENLLDNLDVSVDVHYRAKSWAVISIQGQRTDFIKFVDLGTTDILEIERFLRQFDRTKIDAAPTEYRFLKLPRSRNIRY